MKVKFEIFLALLLIAVAALLFFKKQDAPIPQRGEVLAALSSQSKLATVEYSLGKVVHFKGKTWMFGSQEALFETRWKVLAGIDLSKIKPENVKISGNQISILLPEAEIISLAIDNQRTREVYSGSNLLALDLTSAEKLELLRKGEQAVRRQVDETDIIKNAAELAGEQLATWLLGLGFEKVVINYSAAGNGYQIMREGRK